jgi:hypothetical protein
VVPFRSWADVAQLVEQSIRNGKFLTRNSAEFLRATLATLPRDRATLLTSPSSAGLPAPGASFYDFVALEHAPGTVRVSVVCRNNPLVGLVTALGGGETLHDWSRSQRSACLRLLHESRSFYGETAGHGRLYSLFVRPAFEH